MKTHSSILAWRVPWTEQPGGPQSMGLTEAPHREAQAGKWKSMSRAKPPLVTTSQINQENWSFLLSPHFAVEKTAA